MPTAELPAYLLHQLNTGTLALRDKVTSMHKAFRDQVECFRMRRREESVASISDVLLLRPVPAVADLLPSA